MTHSKPRLIKVGWSMTNSPGVTFVSRVAAVARSPTLKSVGTNTTPRHMTAQIVVFILAFREDPATTVCLFASPSNLHCATLTQKPVSHHAHPRRFQEADERP